MSPALESLRSAVTATAEVPKRCQDQEHLARLDRPTRLGLRAGRIEHFEFICELSWKLMRREVLDVFGPPAAALYTRNDPTCRSGWTCWTGTRSPRASAGSSARSSS